MRVSLVHRLSTGFDDVGRGMEIRLADFEVNDLSSLCFESLCFHQDIESGFRSQTI